MRADERCVADVSLGGQPPRRAYVEMYRSTETASALLAWCDRENALLASLLPQSNGGAAVTGQMFGALSWAEIERIQGELSALQQRQRQSEARLTSLRQLAAHLQQQPQPQPQDSSSPNGLVLPLSVVECAMESVAAAVPVMQRGLAEASQQLRSAKMSSEPSQVRSLCCTSFRPL